MSDYIRVDLTPEEAKVLFDIAAQAGEREIAARIYEARKNPLNGPTFEWAVSK